MKKHFSTYSLVLMALFAAVLSVSAYISIPLPAGSHLTLLNFIVILIALTFPLQQAFTITLVWFLLGSIGVPVFIAGAAGIGYLISGWGGYTFSFLLVSIIIPLLCRKNYNRIYYTLLAILAVFIIDIFGAAWLMFVTKISLQQAMLTGVVTFLPLDLLKAVAVAQIVPQFRKIVSTGISAKTA